MWDGMAGVECVEEGEEETDYEHRGYYSYFVDMVMTLTNVMEQVIFELLLPLAQQRTSQKIVGAEWWVHTRPIEANIGHNLHFDTDEAMLAQEGKITHPVVSSVLYLTGNASQADTLPAGSTIISDQTPNSKNPAKTCYICPPRDNSFLVFPDDMLHGVLPCPGSIWSESIVDVTISSKNQCELSWTVLPTDESNAAADATMPTNRLTLMVGFWTTRRVPDQRKERSLYGPCGPMPVDSDWMKQLLPKVKKAAATAATPTTFAPYLYRKCCKPCHLPGRGSNLVQMNPSRGWTYHEVWIINSLSRELLSAFAIPCFQCMTSQMITRIMTMNR